ncbi:hypothetical protein M405DRAFT_856602 [Rhizopogon salebrosus TDB-379]|nr:hypothetical protein M405DRAFT_856602 [Rhizopogon salebrosus TDB-379]
MVDTDDAKSKYESKELSKNMGDKLDTEKGRAIVSLEAPDFKWNTSTDLIYQRAVECLPSGWDIRVSGTNSSAISILV